MADRAPPTPVAMIIGTALIAGISGYLFGIGSGLGIFPNPFVAKEPRKRGIDNYDDEEESEDEDIDASILDHAPNWSNGFEADKRDGLRATAAGKAKDVKKEVVKKEPSIKQEPETESMEKIPDALEDTGEECKMVLVVRTDLGMTKGMTLNCALYKPLLTIPQAKLQHNADTRP